MKTVNDQSSDRPVAWCATCGDEQTDIDQWLVGTRFRCEKPPTTKFHVAAIVPPSMKCWLRGLSKLVSWTDAPFHPRVFLAKSSAGRYGVILIGLTVVALTFPMSAWRLRWLAVACAMWVIVDLLVYNIRAAFITQHPQVPLRNALFGLVGFALLACNFAALYLSFVPNDFQPVCLTRMSAVYFSFVTMATIGFGDIHPGATASFAQVLVIAEVLVGLFYVAVVLVTLAAWANATAPLPTLEQLRQRK